MLLKRKSENYIAYASLLNKLFMKSSADLFLTHCSLVVIPKIEIGLFQYIVWESLFSIQWVKVCPYLVDFTTRFSSNFEKPRCTVLLLGGIWYVEGTHWNHLWVLIRTGSHRQLIPNSIHNMRYGEIRKIFT